MDALENYIITLCMYYTIDIASSDINIDPISVSEIYNISVSLQNYSLGYVMLKNIASLNPNKDYSMELVLLKILTYKYTKQAPIEWNDQLFVNQKCSSYSQFEKYLKSEDFDAYESYVSMRSFQQSQY